MAINYQYDEISLFSIKSDLEGYSKETLRRDLSAAFSVAMMTFPQAMAYALIAGLPLSCGLFAAIFSTIIAATFGSSRQLVVGPSNALAILIQSAIAEVLFSFYRDATGQERELIAMQVLTQLMLLVGVFQLLVALFRLGRLAQFVSHSVIVGYIAGSALAIIVNQLQTFLGLPSLQGVYSLYQRSVYIVTHLTMVHLPTALIGLSSLVGLAILKKTRLPASIIIIAISGLSVHYLGLSSYTETDIFNPYQDEMIGKVPLIGDAEEIYGMLPTFSLPYFDTRIMNHLLPFAFAIAFLSVLETASVVKNLATSTGQRLALNQEIFGVSLANLFASCIGALPVCGNPSRSMLMYSSGGKTRLAAIINALFILAIMLALGFFVNRIPLTTLSALLLFNALVIVNMKQFFFCMKATRSDAFVLFTTLLSCIFFSLHIAFYIGVVLSITLYLKKASMPHLVECTFDDSGRIGNIDYVKNKPRTRIRMINVHGELFFGAADLFQTTLKTLAEDDDNTLVIILRLKNARDIDATACLALKQLYEFLKSTNRHLIACGLTEQSWEVLCDSGLVDLIGKENLFIYDERNPNQTVQRALCRAKALLKEPQPHRGQQEPSLQTVHYKVQDLKA
jgi:SulP family sulfate permease